MMMKLMIWFSDPKCKKIYTFLLSKASAPYFEMLNSWIYHGEIIDPYNEFMILEFMTISLVQVEKHSGERP